MNIALAAISAVLLSTGVALLVHLALSARETTVPSPRSSVRLPEQLGLRVGLAAVGAIGVTATTGWPVAGLWVGALGFATPGLLGVNQRRAKDVERIEAVAVWTEMLRDQAAAGADLAQAVQVSAGHAPAVLAQPVARLAIRLRRQSPEEAFREFSREVADPTADLVASALTVAFSGQARRVGDVLATLATSAREQASMRLRIERDRKRVRTVARGTGAVVIGWTVLVYVISGQFFATYSTVSGQLVLLLVGGLFALGIVGLARLDRLPGTRQGRPQ
jgi:tight adherence protein B